jgi:phosphohistidine phosphatase
MYIYLLRHAEAETDAPRNELRALTNKGRNQAQKVGRFCLEHRIAPDVVLTSPLVRAEETARIVAEKLDLANLVCVESFLREGMAPAAAFSGLREYRDKVSVLLVGHEPDFSSLASELVGTSSHSIHMRKATLLKVQTPTLEPRTGVIEFLLPVKFL